MNKSILIVVMSLGMAAPVFAAEAGSDCGDPHRVTELFMDAVYASDRADAEGKLIQGVYPVVSCLSREGYLTQPSELKGRFSLVLEVLAALRRQSLHVSTPEDIDRQVRLWKVHSAGMDK